VLWFTGFQTTLILLFVFCLSESSNIYPRSEIIHVVNLSLVLPHDGRHVWFICTVIYLISKHVLHLAALFDSIMLFPLPTRWSTNSQVFVYLYILNVRK